MGNKQGSGKDFGGGLASPKFKTQSTIGQVGRDEQVGAKLKNVPLLAQYSDDERATLGAVLEEKKYAQGEKLITQGEAGEGFYIIQKGECVVTREAEGKTTELGRLKDGDYFGELALLTNKARGASVTAVTPIIAFFLLRSHFQKLFNPEALNVKFAKRAAVSAEAKQKEVEFKAPKDAVVTKDAATTALILEAVKDNILFSGQAESTRARIVAEMYKQSFKSGETVIKQGDNGEFFYVVQTGSFDILVNDKKVAARGAGTCFGELALMYNAPRAATVRASGDGVCWVVHRYVYRRIVKDVSAATLEEYTSFLKTVPLLGPLASYERERMAEAMEEVTFAAGAIIFEQGSEGDVMYIVRKGEVVVEKDGKEVSRCKNGDYFGERALLKNDTRAATVKAVSDCVCLQMDRNAFHLLLGPLEEVLEQAAAGYEPGGTSKSAPAEEKKEAASAGSDSVVTDIKFGDLKVLGTLGKGSFGHVQLVQDKNTTKTYALKAVSKAMIVETGQQGHIMSEKKVMIQLKHPFLIDLHQTFKDKDRLYFLLEPVLGGELFSILRAQSLFDENTARFYAGCVVSAFEYMHETDIVYRDLKPENLLVDQQGYIKITDFGFAKVITTGRTWTLCGTPDYLAPEIVAGKGHGKGVDWWTLGILIYEMLASYPPFYDEDHMKTYAKIMTGDITYPSHFSKPAVSIIKKLLNRKATKRLGVVKGGAKLIKKHPWFETLDFVELYKKNVKAPMIPTIKGNTDLSNFDDMEDEESDPIQPYEDDGSGWDNDF